MSVQVHFMRSELIAGGERLGEGVITGIEIYHFDAALNVEIPIDRAGIDHINAIATGNRIDLTLRLTGWLRAQKT